MARWKISIKKLADDLRLSKAKVEKIIDNIESMYSQKEMPSFYKGKRNDFLYDKAQKEIFKLVQAY